MKILVSGGTGFIGTNLSRRLLERGHRVTLLSSSGKSQLSHGSLQFLQADTTVPGDWQKELGDYDVIVNLAGRSIFHLWTEAYKKQMYSSRVDTTKNIVEALPSNTNTILMSASAAGFYGNSGDEEHTEESPAGTDFLARVCKDWEAAALEATKKGSRVVIMRFGVVLGADGGAIATMKTPFQLGMGGPIGNGMQWFPWIHIKDLVEALLFLLDGSDLEGPFNFTAPETVRQKNFARMLGKILKRPAILPAPTFIMKKILGEFGESLLQGQRVVPQELQRRGFLFSHPNLEGALREILGG